jgi:hypothetical protein
VTSKSGIVTAKYKATFEIVFPELLESLNMVELKSD